MYRVLDLFSCLGAHAIGMYRAGLQTVAFVESSQFRREQLADRFPRALLYADVRTYPAMPGTAEVIVGGPPCQRTSVAAAIHGRRDGDSLWPDMLRICNIVRPEWIIVEQPPGNAAWEAQVADDLRGDGFHTARVEFAASDVGAPYLRRRVFILASSRMSRLAVAWAAIPSAIERVKRAADARGAWDPRVLETLPVDAQSAGEMARERSRGRREMIEALGDSNPPEMMEVIGRAILAADQMQHAA